MKLFRANHKKVFFKPKLKPTFKLKNYYNSIIPLTVYQTWYTKDLPQNMKKTIMYNKLCNPKFNFVLYDDNDCREFIKNNFDLTVLQTFDKLKPGAYKADLWRYCILYINGGIYVDIKFRCVNGFKFISLTEKEHFPTDVVISEYRNEPNRAVYNGFMVSLPNNEKLKNAIQQVVENVKNNYYGNSPLDITGPIMFGNFFTYDEKKNSITKRYVGRQGNGVSIGNIIILDEYQDYRNEQKQKTIHYNEYWRNKNVYY
jgi:mannosyltransferase OCH1-like enzyme